MHRLMVVDDEAVIAMQLEESLAAMGYDVVGTAASGEEAREMAKNVRPDLILMDIVMPGKQDGIVAAEAIKSEMDIPIIFLTAYAEENLVQRAKKVEPMGYIVKPFQERGLKAAIEVAFYKKESEQRLRDSEEMLSGIIDSLADHMSMIDEQHNIVWTNEVTKHFFKPDIIGMKCYAVYRQRDKPCESCEVSKCFQDGKLYESELELRSADGNQQSFWCKTNVALRNKDGRPRTVVGVCRNITERKQAEEEKSKLEARFQEAQKMEAISTLAGGIAHDFNNLLTTVQGNASLMLYDIDSTHPHYEMLEEITKQSRSGARLTAQLLGYARKGRYEVKLINLNGVVEKASYTFGRTHKEIAIHQELAEDLFGIKADQSQIEQVLLNLFINAATAMPRGGTLTLNSTNVTHEDIKDTVYDARPGNYVQLTVRDTGTGMKEETRERIFEPFFTTKEMGRGTGLGLASVYGIIKGHGGYIHLDSEKGRGTTFSIYLPASDKKIETVAKTAKPLAKGSGTILLVDDEAAVLKVGIKMLKKMGYTVLEAKSGREAIEIYKANKDKIDLVILDMIMPDMGGGEAYDRMKEINPDVKVLLSSGYSIEGQATEILKRGCDAFIQKPFDMAKLSGTIGEFIDKK